MPIHKEYMTNGEKNKWYSNNNQPRAFANQKLNKRWPLGFALPEIRLAILRRPPQELLPLTS